MTPFEVLSLAAAALALLPAGLFFANLRAFRRAPASAGGKYSRTMIA